MDLIECARQGLERPEPLEPVPTGVEPRGGELPGIRAVLFDLYGTLLISAAGDISLVSETASKQGMQEALQILGGESVAVSEGVSEAATEAALRLYQDGILQRQEARRAVGVAFPEVEIRDVWRELAAATGLSDDRIEEAAIRYECAVNPCAAMPGAAEVIRGLHAQGLILGIISNAQFYTGAVFSAATGVDLSGDLFAPDLSFFSFREGVGKPAPELFRKAAAAAADRGIAPEEIFYLGNDFHKDIEPARAAGFRTGLFAGDRRSLRTGTVSLGEACESADAVLTELPRLFEILT